MGIVESEGGGLLGVEAREFAMGCATVVWRRGAMLCYGVSAIRLGSRECGRRCRCGCQGRVGMGVGVRGGGRWQREWGETAIGSSGVGGA